MDKITWTCKSVTGAWSISTHLPTGKELKFDFKQVNGTGDFLCDLPERIEFKDEFGHQKVFNENYAAHVLNAYGTKVVVPIKKNVTAEVSTDPIVIPSDAPTVTPTTVVVPPISRETLAKFNRDELVALAEAKSLTVTDEQTKTDIINLIAPAEPEGAANA